METVQFQATANYLNLPDDYRGFALGRFEPPDDGQLQTRMKAWAMRALANALSATPDGDTALRNSFKASVQANIDLMYSRYVAQPNNIMGWIQPGEDGYQSPGGWRVGAPWQQDFVTGAWGYAVALGLPLDTGYQAKALNFFKWKAQSIVGRLGDSTGFDFRFAAQYDMTLSVANYPDYRGGTGSGFYSDWASLYAAARARSASTFDNAGTNSLGGNLGPASGVSGATAYWGNLQPAIAYAVRHGAPGALTAYKRMTGAVDWYQLAGGLNSNPVWAVKPASGESATPAWLAGKPINRWFAIGGTSTGVGSGIDAYSGWSYREDTLELYSVACGGHNDSDDNAAYAIRLSDDAPAWVKRTAGSPVGATGRPINSAYYPDGKPSSRHTYNHNHWVPSLSRVIMFGAWYCWGGDAYTFPAVDGWNPNTNAYDPAATYPNTPDGSGSWSPTAGKWINLTGGYESVVCMVPGVSEGWTNGRKRWRAGIGYDSPIASPVVGQSTNQPWAYDSNRDQLFKVLWGNGQGDNPERGLQAEIIRRGNFTNAVITFNPSAALSLLIADTPLYAGMCYDPVNDCFWFYDGSVPGRTNHLFRINPNSGTTWDIELFAPDSGSVTLPQTGGGGTNSRLTYVAAFKGIVFMPYRDAGLYFMRTA
jgi:hypothetical protein